MRTRTQGAHAPHSRDEKIQGYVEAVATMLAQKGLDVARVANHEALRTGLVDLEMFQAAARYLVKFRLGQIENH